MPTTSVTAAVVRQFGQQFLESVEEEALSQAQQVELLNWAYDHLLSAYVARHLDASAELAAGSMHKPLIKPCTSALETIGNMLQGGIPLEEDLSFHCPPVCCQYAHALHDQLPTWVRQRVQLAAQRTRWHTRAELALLWEAVVMHLITGSIVYFDLAKWLEVDVPTAETLEVATRGCLEAMCGARGLAWTPGGAVWR